MKVKNINGTSQNRCKCGSWINHWENYSGLKATACSAIGCVNKDLVGAHVQKDSIYDSNWYIVPLCNSHNFTNGVINIVYGTKLVSANVANTCDK